MGPAASSDKADGRSLPVQIPTRKEQMGIRNLRWKKEIAHVLGHADKHTHTHTDTQSHTMYVTQAKHISLRGKLKIRSYLKLLFYFFY